VQCDKFDLLLYMGPDTSTAHEDPFTWFAVIKGPEGSPFEGGTFKMKISIPDEYPSVPPKIEFLTPVYHPNISSNGDICLDILEAEHWNECLTIQKVILSIVSLMTDANPGDALCPDIGALYLRDRKKYDAIATEWTFKHAK